MNKNYSSSRLELLQSKPFRIENLLSVPIASDLTGHVFGPLRQSKYLYSAASDFDIRSMSGLKVAQWNCHVSSNHHDVNNFLEIFKGNIDILGICESFFTQENFLSSHFFPGYQIVGKSRTVMRGGGLAFLVKNGINFTVLNDFCYWNEGKLEILSIEAQIDKRKILISSVYRPPSATPDDFFGDFEQFMTNVLRRNRECVFIGDFNFDLLKLTGPNLDFLNLMLCHGYYPTVTIPTRITEHSATLIDNIFVSSDLIAQCHSDVSVTPGSDHLPSVCTIRSISKPKIAKEKYLSREMKAENLKKFKDEVSVLFWQEVTDINDDPSRAFDKFMDILGPIYDRCCPVLEIQKRKRTPRKPWITDEITDLMQVRDDLFKAYLNCESDSSWEAFRKVRNKVNSLRRTAMKQFYSDKFEQHKGDMQGTWQTIKNVLGTGKSSAFPEKVEINGHSVHNEKDITNEFCKYFSRIGSDISSEAGKNSDQFSEQEFLDNRGESQSFSFVECNLNDVSKAVKSIKSNSAGMDGLNFRRLKL